MSQVCIRNELNNDGKFNFNKKDIDEFNPVNFINYYKGINIYLKIDSFEVNEQYDIETNDTNLLAIKRLIDSHENDLKISDSSAERLFKIDQIKRLNDDYTNKLNELLSKNNINVFMKVFIPCLNLKFTVNLIELESFVNRYSYLFDNEDRSINENISMLKSNKV
jgi:hypothetical protein